MGLPNTSQKKRPRFTDQAPPMMERPQQPPMQMPAQPDFMGLMSMIQQGQQALLKQDQQPRRGAVSPDQHVQRGTPGLDQWHRNNPNATVGLPGQNYGQSGPDVPAGPNPAMHSAQGDANGDGKPDHASGFMKMLGDGLMSLLGGGQQASAQAPQNKSVQTPGQIQNTNAMALSDANAQKMVDADQRLSQKLDKNNQAYSVQQRLQSDWFNTVIGDSEKDVNISSYGPLQNLVRAFTPVREQVPAQPGPMNYDQFDASQYPPAYSPQGQQRANRNNTNRLNSLLDRTGSSMRLNSQAPQPPPYRGPLQSAQQEPPKPLQTQEGFNNPAQTPSQGLNVKFGEMPFNAKTGPGEKYRRLLEQGYTSKQAAQLGGMEDQKTTGTFENTGLGALMNWMNKF